MIRIKRILASLLVCVMVVGILAGCGSTSDDKIIIRMSHTQQPESISDLTAKEFTKYVDEESNGRIQVEIYQNCGLSGSDLTKAI